MAPIAGEIPSFQSEKGKRQYGKKFWSGRNAWPDLEWSWKNKQEKGAINRAVRKEGSKWKTSCKKWEGFRKHGNGSYKIIFKNYKMLTIRSWHLMTKQLQFICKLSNTPRLRSPNQCYSLDFFMCSSPPFFGTPAHPSGRGLLFCLFSGRGAQIYWKI